MSFASSYHVFYWLQLPKKKKGPLSPDIFQAKIHVKCSSFRDMGPVRPKSGKQDVQTGPGQGRHLPSPSDQKIDRPQPGLTTVSLRDRFWRFQPNRSSPPRGSSAILFASAVLLSVAVAACHCGSSDGTRTKTRTRAVRTMMRPGTQLLWSTHLLSSCTSWSSSIGPFLHRRFLL